MLSGDHRCRRSRKDSQTIPGSLRVPCSMRCIMKINLTRVHRQSRLSVCLLITVWFYLSHTQLYTYSISTYTFAHAHSGHNRPPKLVNGILLLGALNHCKIYIFYIWSIPCGPTTMLLYDQKYNKTIICINNLIYNLLCCKCGIISNFIRNICPSSNRIARCLAITRAIHLDHWNLLLQSRRINYTSLCL